MHHTYTHCTQIFTTQQTLNIKGDKKYIYKERKGKKHTCKKNDTYKETRVFI